MVKILREGNHVPIDFFGKAIDQNSNPIQGISVEGHIQYNDGHSEGVKKVYTKSDIKGEFHISGERGKSLGIGFLNTNYLSMSTNTYFIYSMLWPAAERHLPDAAHPILFQLWKKTRNPEPLLRIEFSLTHDFWSAPVNIDLMEGRVVESGGDIAIHFLGQKPGKEDRASPHWSVELVAPNGGLIPVGDIVPVYRPPPQEWSSKLVFEPESFPDDGFNNYISQGVLLKSRDGRCYFKLGLGLSVAAREPGAGATFRGLVNTNSSPSWEGQPLEGWY
jgi:hypothetical protein